MSETPPTRRSERKRAVNTRIADFDSSPSQRAPPPSKKRKASSQAPRRPRPRQQTPEDDAISQHDGSDEETAAEDEGSFDDIPKDVEVVIPLLTASKDPIVMTRTHHNSIAEKTYGNETIQAFAKVCGRDWTYYVQAPIINFGREQAPQLPQSSDPASSAAQAKDDEPSIEIDLGPSKVVSRLHASIKYGQVDGQWQVEVYGRNGVRVDDEDLRRGQTRPVHSGTVITIAGTEMLFQIAEQDAQIHQRFIDRVLKYDEDHEHGGMFDDFGHGRPPPQAYFPIPGPSLNGALPMSHHPSLTRGYYPQSGFTPGSMGMVRRPVTPTPSPPKQAGTGSTKKRSPGSRRGINGIMMESTEQIDYSLDSSSQLKPACSYASMITWAILSAPDETLSLAGIYLWIKTHYAYYRKSQGGWQNSIRHNLSLNQAFFKVPRRSDEPGKGMKWALEAKLREATISMANKNASKGGGRVSSAPGSPIGGPSSGGFLPIAPNGDAKRSPRSRTPPLSSFPPAHPESYTPTRGPQMPAPAYTPQMPAYAPTQGPLPVFSDETSPMPRRRTNGQLPAADSSPTLTSGNWGTDAPMRTPIPRPHNLIVPQPNTAKLPTSHMADSSPAPFWRYDNPNSTPAGHWPEISPLKGSVAGPALPSSSPPPLPNGIESPTRKPKPPVFGANQNGTPKGDDDDGGIDITRGFPKISSFHEQRSNANGAKPPPSE